MIQSQDYFTEVTQWLQDSHRQWRESLAGIEEAQLAEERPVHWGEHRPLFEIVLIIAGHNTYHDGEINQILSILRGEAWEEGEEVEENLAPSAGHRVVPPWKRGT